MQFCKLAIVETKDRAAELIDHLKTEDKGGLARIGFASTSTVAPNACAQYQVADVGLQGGVARLEDGGTGFHPARGRSAGHRGGGFARRVSSKAIPGRSRSRYVVERIVRAYAGYGPARRHLRRLGSRPVRRAAGGAGGRRGCPQAGGRGRLTATVATIDGRRRQFSSSSERHVGNSGRYQHAHSRETEGSGPVNLGNQARHGRGRCQSPAEPRLRQSVLNGRHRDAGSPSEAIEMKAGSLVCKGCALAAYPLKNREVRAPLRAA